MKDYETKIKRLQTLRDALSDLMAQCEMDAEEWKFYNTMAANVNNEFYKEQQRLGYMAVYSITEGTAGKSLFEGTLADCRLYVGILLKISPELEGNLMLLPL